MGRLTTLTLLIVFLMTPWVWNVEKLTECDFKSDFKCELIHGIGFAVPPTSWVTVWFDTDKK